MTEKQIQAKIIHYLRKVLKQGLWIKIPQGMFSLPGISDILGCYFGAFFAFEVKTETGALTKTQRIFLFLVKKAGGQAHCVRSVDEVKEIINEYTLRAKTCTCICQPGMERNSDKAGLENPTCKMETVSNQKTHNRTDINVVQKMAEK